jgi:hypothetical protein
MLNKKGAAISVLILVLFAGILSSMVFGYLYTKGNSLEERITTPSYGDDIYLKKVQIEFILEEIFENVVVDIKFEDGKNVFISDFKKELEDYKQESGEYFVKELVQIDDQLIEDEINLDDEKISVTFSFNLSELELVDYDAIRVDYAFDINLEKNF